MNPPSPQSVRSSPLGRRSHFVLAGLCSIVLCAAGAWLWFQHRRNVTFEAALRDARIALAESRFELALDACEQAIAIRSHSPEALLIAAEAELGRGQPQQVSKWLTQWEALSSAATYRDLELVGRLWLDSGFAGPAESAFRRAISASEEGASSESVVSARLQLMQLLRLQGRHFELAPLIERSLADGNCPSEFLFVVGWPHRLWLDDDDRKRLALLRSRNANDPWLLLGPDAAKNEEHADQEDVLRQILRSVPDQIEAQARLGKLLSDQARWDDFRVWEQSLSSSSHQHPDVWFARALRANAHQQFDSAIRCCAESLRRSPFHYGATFLLARLLQNSTSRTHAAAFEDRAEALAELQKSLVYGRGQGGFPDSTVIKSIVEILDRLGRHSEVRGWCEIAIKRDSRSTSWAQRWLAPLPASAPLAGSASVDSSRSGPLEELLNRIEWSKFPLPSESRSEKRTATQAELIDANAQSTRVQHIHFGNVAEAAGLQFQFRNGANPQSGRAHMVEVSGGGIGVLDFDADGWPDLYLTQGGTGAPAIAHDPVGDQFFRNMDGPERRRFVDVTRLTRITDEGYGQGVAAGDFDNDGWTDLFVANVGRNRLFRNLGDGTFSDETHALGHNGGIWTMSAAIADLSGDAVPDLYAVNYLAGDVFQRPCSRSDRPVQCRPTMFPPEQDIFLAGDGIGRFADQTEPSGLISPHGKGMGISTITLDGATSPSLFISNDMTPNSLFSPSVNDKRELRFRDVGVLAGVALGEAGETQASMGIAVGDVNRDGLDDLFVTNFAGQPNNLYIQQPGGLFSDRSRALGIYGPSLPLMGWGTQFLDADLDGYPEIVVANGHLEDLTAFGESSRMPTQVFRNNRGEGFQEVEAAVLGDYFRQTYLGRTVARIDWNLDAQEDFVVSHVEAPIALLENQTQHSNHALVLQFVGTQSARDAIGTQIRMTIDGVEFQKTMTAGDGFQCSQHRQMIIGVGAVRVIESLHVTWPSGITRTFHNLPTDTSLRIVESHSQWFALFPK